MSIYVTEGGLGSAGQKVLSKNPHRPMDTSQTMNRGGGSATIEVKGPSLCAGQD